MENFDPFDRAENFCRGSYKAFLHDSGQIFVRIEIRVDTLSVYNETCLSSQIFGNEMSKIMKCIVHN